MNTFIIAAFWLAVFATAVSGLLYIRNFFSTAESERLDALAGDLAVTSFGLMALSIIAQWLYLGISEFGVPFATRVVYVLSLIGGYLLIESLYSSRSGKVKIAGIFVMPAALVLEFYAWAGWRLEHGITPALQSGWVAVHVIFALVAYGALTMALVMSLLNLIEERRLRTKKSLTKTFKKFPSLETLEALTFKASSVAFVFLTLVIIAGVARAQMLPAWSRWWADPKIILAFATWGVFGLYLAARTVLGWRGRHANLLIIIGFIAAVVTYLMNYLLPTIHQYGRGF